MRTRFAPFASNSTVLGCFIFLSGVLFGVFAHAVHSRTVANICNYLLSPIAHGLRSSLDAQICSSWLSRRFFPFYSRYIEAPVEYAIASIAFWLVDIPGHNCLPYNTLHLLSIIYVFTTLLCCVAVICIICRSINTPRTVENKRHKLD